MKSLTNQLYKLTAISGILAVAFFSFAGNVNAADITVTTPAELTTAVTNAVSGDVISVDGTLGSTSEYTLYEITASDVTIRGISGNKIYGTFNLKGDNDTLDNLNVYNRGGGSDSLKNAVNVVSKSVNIINSRFEMPTPDLVAAGGGVGNGIVVWPYGNATPNLNITGNTFVGYGATVTNWASTAILIAEEIDMTRVGMGGTPSVTIAPSNEQSVATNNSFTGSYYDYVHTNWNGGYKVLYSRVSNSAALVDVVSDSTDGATILLGSDITTASQLDISKALTLDGAGHTLFTTAVGGSVINILANDVTIKNLVEDGGGVAGNNRGINVYMVADVTLDNVTVTNNKKHGVVVNGSLVTVNNITTANNGWGGIDVDQGSGVTSQAILTISGASSHTETVRDIWVDDNLKAVSVNGAVNQYSRTVVPYVDSHGVSFNGTAYKLLAAGQVIPENGTATVTPEDKEVVVTATNPITVNLGNVEDATINFDSLIDDVTDSGILPETTITSDVATVEIPDATTVTAAGWNGIMQAPTVGSTSGTAPASFSVGNVVIEMGSPEFTLTFDKAVKITLPGVTGRVGYKPAGSSEWQLITTQCTSATDPGITSGECYVADGGNTVIWTYHFTTFGNLDPISINRSGGRSGGSRITVLPSQASPVAAGRVLGAFTGPEGTNIDSPAVVALKAQIAGLIAQLIGLLREQLATAIAAGLR